MNHLKKSFYWPCSEYTLVPVEKWDRYLKQNFSSRISVLIICVSIRSSKKICSKIQHLGKDCSERTRLSICAFRSEGIVIVIVMFNAIQFSLVQFSQQNNQLPITVYFLQSVAMNSFEMPVKNLWKFVKKYSWKSMLFLYTFDISDKNAFEEIYSVSCKCMFSTQNQTNTGQKKFCHQ